MTSPRWEEMFIYICYDAIYELILFSPPCKLNIKFCVKMPGKSARCNLSPSAFSNGRNNTKLTIQSDFYSL